MKKKILISILGILIIGVIVLYAIGKLKIDITPSHQLSKQDKLDMQLGIAVSEGDTALVRKLVKEGARLNSPEYKSVGNFDNNTIGCREVSSNLHMAVVYGDLRMVQTLVELGAEVNALNSEGKTPLDKAGKTVEIYAGEEVYSQIPKVPVSPAAVEKIKEYLVAIGGKTGAEIKSSKSQIKGNEKAESPPRP